jgi:PAS domain S-box-containing protein
VFAVDTSPGPDRAFDTLLMSSTVAIVAIDRAGRVLLWNRGAVRLLGWREEEVVGTVLPGIRPEDRDRFASMRRRIMGGEPIDGVVMTHVRKDGDHVELEIEGVGTLEHDVSFE